MSFITRDDGERFVIPSYRDVLSAKKPSLLRKEIQLLSTDYGEYIALQRKPPDKYEAAFSPDAGYLLGETVWHYFQRPADLVYCEEIPNTGEAILVIVKSGSVHLDGIFPKDSIPDELVIFRTQKNNFDIYIYGDVPITEAPVEGKFSFDPTSVKSFHVLNTPAFPELPLVKDFQLQLVNVALREKGIGVFPIKKVLVTLVVLGLLWMAWSYYSSLQKVPPPPPPPPVNPYQGYIAALSTPDPGIEVRWIATNIWLLSTIPGWTPVSLEYTKGVLTAGVKSLGARTNLLFEWAERNYTKIEIKSSGFYLVISGGFPYRHPTTISRLNDVIANLTDSMSYIIPGNNLVVSEAANKGVYSERQVTINFTDINPIILDIISRLLENLPLELVKVSIKITNGSLSGSINLRALGN